MAIIIRNGIEYAGGGSGGIEITQAGYNALGDKVKTDGVTYFIIDPDEEQSFAENCKVRYVDDPNDENYDWVQVCHNGTWINDHRAYTQRYELYVDQNNGGEFSAYKGSITHANTAAHGTPTTVFADTMYASQSAVSTGSGYGVGCIISKLIDLSRYKTIKFHHVSNTVGTTVATVKFFITQSKTPLMTAIMYQMLSNSSSNEEDISIDISALNGEYYIAIELCGYSSTTASCKISNMYME